MIIRTTTELVRYIRHHLAGSEWEDEKAVDEYVNMRTKELMQRIHELEETIDRLKDPDER